MVAAVAELLMFKLGHCEIQFGPLRDKTGSAHKTYRDLGPIQETWRDPLDQKSANGMVRPCSGPARTRSWQGALKTRSTPCLRNATQRFAVIGIDIGKNSFHIVGHDHRGAIVLRQKWSRGQGETRLANLPPCLIGMEACVGAHHLSRKLQMLG